MVAVRSEAVACSLAEWNSGSVRTHAARDACHWAQDDEAPMLDLVAHAGRHLVALERPDDVPRLAVCAGGTDRTGAHKSE